MQKILLFALCVALPLAAQAQEYPLSDDGEYILPSGSKVACVTSQSSSGNAAWCTMQLQGDDTAEAFPTSVTRFGQTFPVLDGNAMYQGHPPSRAWTNCEGNCIVSK